MRIVGPAPSGPASVAGNGGCSSITGRSDFHTSYNGARRIPFSSGILRNFTPQATSTTGGRAKSGKPATAASLVSTPAATLGPARHAPLPTRTPAHARTRIGAPHLTVDGKM